MAKGISFELIGTEKLVRRLQVFTRNMNLVSEESVTRAGTYMQSEIKASIKGMRQERGPWTIKPRRYGNKTRGPIVSDSFDTGAFHRSILNLSAGPKTRVIFSTVPYAETLENKYNGGRRHFAERFKDAKPKIIASFEKEIRSVARKS